MNDLPELRDRPPAARRGRRPVHSPLAPALAALLLAVLAGGCSKADATAGDRDRPAAEPPLVRVVKVELRPVQREIRTTGFLESEHQDTVRAQASGRLLALHADEGSRVERGALLAEIDDRETRSALEQLEAQRDRFEVEKQLAELEVEAAGRRTQQARIEAQKAKAEYDRQAQIDPEFVAPKALQDAELVWQGAEQAARIAEFNERKAALEVTRIATSIDEAAARIHELQVRIEYFRVVAPFAGVVTRRLVTTGAVLGSNGGGTPLFDMIDPDNLVAYLDRPQAELDLVRQSKFVTFTTDALPGREFTADVDMISPIVDRATGHFRLRMRVRPADARTLVHGMFIRAVIRAEEVRDALMVPKSAVLAEGDVSVVMAARGGKAFRTDLDPGLEQGDWVECKNLGSGGLEPGDLVIVEGHEDLEDQSAVRVAQ